MGEKFVQCVVPSLVWGCLSCLADSDAVASDVGQQYVTSTDSTEKPWIGDVVAVAGVQHTLAHLGLALGDMAAEDIGTSLVPVAFESLGLHTERVVGHVQMEMPQTLESWIAEYDTKSGDIDLGAACERWP
jgi:hypothetical protein